MPADYFTAEQRREALVAWLRRNYGQGYFNVAEASRVKDVFTDLYGSDATARRDLEALAGEGRAERDLRGMGQWRLTS